MSDTRRPTIEVRRYRLADGGVAERWSVRSWDTAGRRRRTFCRSREEAEFERARLVLEQSRGVVSGLPVSMSVSDDPPARTLGDFLVTWHADASSRLASSTVKDYEGVWRRRIAERFADVSMDRIRPRDVSLWRAEMLAAGLGPETVRRAMVLLQAMFTVAIEWGEVTANPVSVVRKPRQGRDRAIEPLTPEAIEALRGELLAVEDRRSTTLVALMAYAGLRPGEALGLARRHVRCDTLLIEQAISDGRVKRQKPGARTGPSTCSSRSPKISPPGSRYSVPAIPTTSCSRAPTAGHGARTTGTTGATATSTRPPDAPACTAHARTTSAMPSPRCSSASRRRRSSSSPTSSATPRP